MSGQHAAKEDAAALGFMAFLALCLGGAGILIAALAVGVERAWSGRDGAPGDGRRQSLADHRAWLDLDRDRRSAWRQARRDWWRDGADPDTRPAGPGWWRRFRDWWHRAWARTALSADRFAEGWRAGYEAARQARRDGASPWETARTRPKADPEADESTGEGPDDPDGTDTDATPDAPSDEPGPQPQQEPAAPGDEETTPNQNDGSTTADEPTPEGEPTMTAPTGTAAATGGETNLDQTEADLAIIQAQLAVVQDHNDQLAGAAARLEGLVAVAEERATSNGATAATQQALDEARAVAALLTQHAAGVSDAATAASDHTAAATAGLAPARDAQDTLHSAGARGEFVSTATSD